MTTGTGRGRGEASEVACLQAVATLIERNPSEFLLRPKHWKVSPSELLEKLPCADAGHQALPVHVPARLRGAGAEAGTPEADARLVELVSECLSTHSGEFDPSWISHRWTGREPRDERVYAEFNKLLPPGGMKTFIESHPEFAWRPRDPRQPDKGMVITWAPPAQAKTAPGAASASGSSVPAAQVAPPAASSQSSPPALGGECSFTPGTASVTLKPEMEADIVD